DVFFHQRIERDPPNRTPDVRAQVIQAGLSGTVRDFFRMNRAEMERNRVSGKNHGGNRQTQNGTYSETAEFRRRPTQWSAVNEFQPNDRQQNHPKLAGNEDEFACRRFRPPKEHHCGNALCRDKQQQSDQRVSGVCAHTDLQSNWDKCSGRHQTILQRAPSPHPAPPLTAGERVPAGRVRRCVYWFVASWTQLGIKASKIFCQNWFNPVTVFFGQNFLSVRMAFLSAEWHGQFGSAGISAMA